jgi:1-phosphofructokinase
LKQHKRQYGGIIMIYTVTLNPSIDYIVHVPNLTLGKLNIMDYDFKLPGGKGINVSRILHELGHETTALGFLGGFTGDYILKWLNQGGLTSKFIQIQEDTRINIKLKTSSEETEINGRGPVISQEEAKKLSDQIESLSSKDTVIFSGSKSPSLPDDFYLQLIEIVHRRNIAFAIDTTGKDLLKAIPHKPLLVKPNIDELSELFREKIHSKDAVIPYGEKLLTLGAQHVIVSMGGEGALLFTKDGYYEGISPKGSVKNSVGAGDSMIAGFIGEYLQSGDPIQAFRMGIACGSATAFSDDLAKKENILPLVNKVEIHQLSK